MGSSMVRTCSSAIIVAGAVLALLAAPDVTQAPQASASARPDTPTVSKFSYPSDWNTFVPLPNGPSVIDTAEYTIRVVTVVNGLSRPWSLAFLPDRSMLVTERTGQLRMIRNGILDPQPIRGVPAVRSTFRDGLMDVVLHPRFTENRLVYLAYTKPGPDNTHTIAIARGRLEGMALQDVRDVFVVSDWMGANLLSEGVRMAFDREGLLYVAVASPSAGGCCAQNPNNHLGKVLRLREDGTAPPDNPFVGREGHKPEIFTLGHRNPSGLAMHPETGLMYEAENGPMGGDEINVIQAGRNYGWPLASDGRQYNGAPLAKHEVLGMEPPLMFWVPAIAISGITFYTGDRFPNWKGNIFVGSMAYTHLERLKFNGKGLPSGRDSREWMLIELKQRIRDVRQGPDGLLYLLTDADFGAVLRIEPAE